MRCEMTKCKFNNEGFCQYGLKTAGGTTTKYAEPEDVLIMKYVVTSPTQCCDKYEEESNDHDA